MPAANVRKKSRNQRKRSKPSFMPIEKRRERRIKRAQKRANWLKSYSARKGEAQTRRNAKRAKRRQEA